MKSSILTFVLLALVVVSVCAAPRKILHQRRYNMKAHPRASQNAQNKVIFTPHPLPCSYTISEFLTMITPFNEEDTQTNDFIVCGPLYKATYTSGDQSFIEQVVYRPDVNISDPESDKIYMFWYHGATMMLDHSEDLLIEEARGVLDIESDLDIYLTPTEFLNVTTGSFGGKKCHIYYDRDDENNVDIYFYADLDKYVLGYNYSMPGADEYITVTYGYDVGLQTFVLNKTLFSDCNDSRAYDRPMVNPCEAPSSSSSPSSSLSSSSPSPSSSHPSPSSSHPSPSSSHPSSSSSHPPPSSSSQSEGSFQLAASGSAVFYLLLAVIAAAVTFLF